MRVSLPGIQYGEPAERTQFWTEALRQVSDAAVASVHLVVRTSGDPHGVLAPIRARIHAIDRDLPLHGTQVMGERLTDAVAQPRHWTLLVGGFARIAVPLGVFGKMSCVVAQQQRDIGVRLALGAA
jgi:putative ABC transport system permease protein